MDSATRSRSGAALELWAGVECTLNRVGDRYGDQLARSGHADRDDDLDRIAALGISTIRQPVLWEGVAPNGVARADWSWVDRRLDRLRTLGVRPIVTLLHHGSGPRETNLLDPSFAERLAEFAHAVAERHPWVRDWTPVNEPLTTARFSALYGLWYPHRRDDDAFARAFMNQMHAVRAAMQAVRTVVPNARLVQTEDLGRTHGVPSLASQIAFENERRWLTFDVLTGAARERSTAWRMLHQRGIGAGELASFVDDPCPPDVVGLNHYLTSERYLDRRLARYPAHTHGGNGTQRYADVEAVRVLTAGPAGPATLLREAWQRYGRPIAVTECHLGCTREQQMRWLADVWSAATIVRGEGVDLRAVTVWSVLGAFDWASLLTRDDGVYEPGAFDVRAPAPRPTALARMAHDLATRGTHDHPALDGDGWWATPRRLLYPPAGALDRRAAIERALTNPRRAAAGARRLLITGARSALGRALVRACEERGLAYHAISLRRLDAANEVALTATLGTLRPWAVVHAAPLVRRRAGRREASVRASLAVARACASHDIALVTFSSHGVFDGTIGRPLTERDATSPRSAYAESLVAAECGVLATCANTLVVRTGPRLDPHSHRGFLAHALGALASGRSVEARDDVVVSPTYVPALVDAVLDLLIDGERGVWHLANTGSLSWHALVQRAAEAAGIDTATLRAVARTDRSFALASDRGWPLDSVENAICLYVATRRNIEGDAAWHHDTPQSPVRGDPRSRRERQSA